jgi:hypothetical protein
MDTYQGAESGASKLQRGKDRGAAPGAMAGRGAIAFQRRSAEELGQGRLVLGQGAPKSQKREEPREAGPGAPLLNQGQLSFRRRHIKKKVSGGGGKEAGPGAPRKQDQGQPVE